MSQPIYQPDGTQPAYAPPTIASASGAPPAYAPPGAIPAVPAPAAPAVPPVYAPPPGGFTQPGGYPQPSEYQQPGGYGPPPAWGQQPIQQFPGQPQRLANGQLAVTSCRFCGNVPAVKATFRGHQGMLVVMRFLSTEGPFCRDCGLGTFRHMTSRTLVQGWYGYASFVITPITVLINLVRRGKVAKLAPPQPNPFGPSRPPMNPGRRLLARPMTWIGLAIPLAVLALLITAIASGS
jgi:hypothetical protein